MTEPERTPEERAEHVYDLFQRGDFVVQVAPQDVDVGDGERVSAMRIVTVGSQHMRERFTRAVDLQKFDKRSESWVSIDCPNDFAVHLDGETPSVRRHTRKCGDAGQERRVAFDKVEKVLRGDAEQGCVRLVLRDHDGKDRSPIHPAKGLEIAAVIENRYVLGNANFSGFRHRCIHHFLC